MIIKRLDNKIFLLISFLRYSKILVKIKITNEPRNIGGSMQDNTNDIQNKLEFLGLDLNNVPKILLENIGDEIRPARNYEEKKYKVYKYVPISQVKILLTRANRMNTLQEKSKMASPLHTYLMPEGEEGILKHTIFLKLIQDLKVSGVKELEAEQKKLEKDIPFKVKYKENYLWQIYYSEYTKTYYMLAPIEDLDCSCLFYLIKEQIKYEKTGKDKNIFVPISYLDYSKRYFTKSQVADIEKYIWQFTKEWPLVYEVYDKSENMSFQIVGNTKVYEGVNSVYKVSLNNDEEAVRFYRLIKALFILETEFPNRYKFEVRIADGGGLEFLYTEEQISKTIDYESLSKFIREEFLKTRILSEEQNEEILELYERLEVTKQEEQDKQEEYQMRQKQVTTYLECKKSFFGKIRYFFKGKRRVKPKENELIQIKRKKEKTNKEDLIYDTKEYYTIDDLINITKVLERTSTQIRNTRADIKALEEAIERLNKKIENAKSYLSEIEEHKKSIFEFWRFVNKDEALGLNEPEVKEDLPRQIEKTFNYEEDMEELGKKIDKQNRKDLSKEECDSLYIANTDVLEDINALKYEKKENFEERLKEIKKEALEQEVLFASEEFDIFGAMTEDKTKISMLGNTKHREIKKSKFRILEITKNTENEQYIETLKDITDNLDSALEKAKFGTKINAYIASTGVLNNQKYSILYINPQNALNTLKDVNKINLYNIKLNENTKAIALTNIVYYENSNKTLPDGMNMSDKIFVDMSKLKLEPKKQKLFRINQEINDIEVQTKIVCVYEYEIVEE